MIRWPFYPFLLSVFVVLSVYAANLDEVSPTEVLLPLAICLVVTGLLFALLHWKIRGWAALAATGFIFLVISPYLAHHIVAYVILFLTAGGLILYLVHHKADAEALPRATPYLNLVALAILLPSVFTIAIEGHFTSGKVLPREPITLTGENRPDIYYILMDRYARADILQRDYDIDNSPFIDALHSRGFSVADRSYANYASTALSIYSTFNMEYVPIDTSYGRACRSLQQTKVSESLKQVGYTFIQMGDWWEWTNFNPHADLNFNRAVSQNFANVVWDQTLVAVPIRFLRSPASPLENAEYKFQKLAAIAEMPEPTFTFAHFLVTHPPYSLGTYQESIAYANACLLQMIDSIPLDAVIIMQSDEGPYVLSDEGEYIPERGWDIDARQHRYAILTAARGVELYPTISHVNTFRVVFNAVFDAKLPLMPDESFQWVDGEEGSKVTL